MSLGIKRYRKEVEQLLLQRDECGALTSEADFIAGASIAFAHFNKWNKVPPMWILAPMCGRSIIEELGFKKNSDGMVTIKMEEYDNEI